MLRIKRTLEPLSLSRSPLILVLAQIRVSPVADIATYFPRYQDRIRKEGFPHLVKREYEQRELTLDGRSEIRKSEQWEFINPEKTTSILVDGGSLVVQTTVYDSAEAFLKVLERAMAVFESVVEPVLVERIGLRYLDLIEPTDQHGLDDLVRPSLRGFECEDLGERRRLVHEAVLETGRDRQLRAKYSEAQGGLALPSDLMGPYSLGFRRNPMRESAFGLLDCDHADRSSRPFSPSEILKTVAELHDHLDMLFRQMVTPEALLSWK